MSDPNVERKKSYRWVSASKVSYDGLDWNSSDDDCDDSRIYDQNNKHDDGVGGGKIENQIDNLPSLPKLNYSDNDSIYRSLHENTEEQQYTSEIQDTNSSKSSVIRSKNDDNALESNFNELSLNKSSSSIDNHKNTDINSSATKTIRSNGNSITSTGNHTNILPLKKNLTSTPSRDINEDLDNLMEQISKEITPQLSRDNNGVFQQDYTITTNNDSNSNMESFVSAKESQSPYISKDRVVVDTENRVPRCGYLKQYLDLNAENNDIDNETDNSSNTNDDTLSFTDSIKYQENNNNLNDNLEREEELEHGDDDNDDILSEEDFKFHNKKLRESILESSDEEDNNNVSNDSIGDDYEHEHIYREEEGTSSYTEVKKRESKDTGDNLEISKSEYFGTITRNDQQDSASNGGNTEEGGECEEVSYKNDFVEGTDDDKQKDEEEESLSIPETVNDGSSMNTDNTNEGEKYLDNIENDENEKLVFPNNNDDDDEADKRSVLKADDSETKNDNESVVSFKHETFVTMNKKSEQENEEKDDLTDDNDDVNTTESWKPDTESLRSGFVQETAKIVVPPPGFVFDENGKLVDLTPSSMKPRVVSTYSEIESGWNMFPTNYGGDSVELETIHDTKTLYDNSTIYNVPGLLTNNQNLPPLPDNINAEMSAGIINRDKNTILNHQSTPMSSNVSNNSLTKTTTPSAGNMNINNDNNIQGLKNTPRIDLHNDMPETNINQIILSKTSHSSKLEKLNNYYDTLFRYDTGLQLWVQHSLNMPREEKEAILDYKQSKIVKEAYANAEELSKKHTVSNTMASVNQNVNHLKKKVLQHTMNPKTLFSSISKGVKL